MTATASRPKPPVIPAQKDSRLEPVEKFFETRGWMPFDFQREVWTRFLNGESGLVQVPTGAGKTYAATMGAFAQMLHEPKPGLRLLYITPLRAVARDIEAALLEPVTRMGWAVRVDSRTGDTKQSLRKKQLDNMPHVLITTPESLELLLSYPGFETRFANVIDVIADEWHELLSSKRGALLELSLARLRRIAPEMRTWALSATIANPLEAARAAVGEAVTPSRVTANLERRTQIETLIPERVDSFPWAGQLGLSMAPALVAALDLNESTLIFTNTRRQAERWYAALLRLRPDAADRMALHHGSITRDERERVEAGLKSGEVRWVVATSSLDLGVDFQPVERVVQIGSPKGVARFLQRAGRAAHTPGGSSRTLFVPTNALELLEIAAIRGAVADGAIEPRHPLEKPYDVLAQHLVTLAVAAPFTAEEVFDEVRSASSFRDLTRAELDWALEFITKGGRSLNAYEEYRRVSLENGKYQVTERAIATRQRQSIGTITSDGAIVVKYMNGADLGTVSESFLSRLKRGDVFTFAGRTVELVMYRDMVAHVRNASTKTSSVPSWSGGRFAISAALSKYLRNTLQDPASATPEERAALEPIMAAQARLSRIPKADELLVEVIKTREGRHLFLYPFEGSRVHDGLGALLALRFSKLEPGSFAISTNDYGLELLARKDYPFQELLESALSAGDDTEAELREAVNLSELSKRAFRDVAQIAGLVYAGRPGARRAAWQLQASSGTIFEVLREYEPESLLLEQATREVLQGELEGERLMGALERIRAGRIVMTEPKRPTPLGFALLVGRLSARLSNEDLLLRVMRMKEQWMKR
jgi:ATP-dependent helicase Lhr and Lhr-like helicase